MNNEMMNLINDAAATQALEVVEKAEQTELEMLRAKLAKIQELEMLRARLAELEKGEAMNQSEEVVAAPKGKKNQVPGKPGNKVYILLTDRLACWGLVPQQQLDIANILIQNMKIGVEYSEKEVFNFLIDGAGDYPSLSKSKQDVTYLFRYYRGLKKDGKHAGFVARLFLVYR